MCTPTNFPSFTRTSFEGPDKYQAKRPLKKNIVEQCASFIRFERINRGATFRIHDVRSSGSTAGCSPALMTSLDGWQARSYCSSVAEDSAAAASAKESELDNPSFLHFKFHDFTHCVSDHLNILVLHPDHSQALERP